MVFLDFLFYNTGDELNFPLTIKMFQKIIPTKVSHLEIFKIEPRIFNFWTFDAKQEKDCSKLVVGREKFNWKINLLNYFHFRPKCGNFQNIWFSKSYNSDPLRDLTDVCQYSPALIKILFRNSSLCHFGIKNWSWKINNGSAHSSMDSRLSPIKIRDA